jgi:glycosyltransferase involved in cell wall biosynthesis
MPGCTDVIRDRWNGFLVPPRDPRLMAERILDLLRDRLAAAAMGARAAQLVRKEFNLEITVTRYATVYEHLLRSSLGSCWRMRRDAPELEPYAHDAASTEA